MAKVLIGIQARTTSTRLPGKVLEYVGTKTVIDHVIARCKNASRYMSVNLRRHKVEAKVAVLAPYNDPIIQRVLGKCPTIQGPEDDVLERYKIAADQEDADYIVRITSDCPLIPPWIISKMVSIVRVTGYHYMNNVDERCRTHPDGWDCEVVSKELLDWVYEEADNPLDREHVTSLIRQKRPPWAAMGFLGSNSPLTSEKLSIDTQEDLDRVISLHREFTDRQAASFAIYGKDCVHSV